MDKIAFLVANVVFIIILTTVMDLLLPHSRMRPYLKLVMGLFIILSIMEPITAVINSSDFLSGWIMVPQATAENNTLMAQSEQYSARLTQEMLTQYEQKINQQMNALLILLDGIANSRAEVTLDRQNGTIEAVALYLEPVETADQHLAQKAVSLISTYFDLPQEKISAYFSLGGESNE